MMGNALPENDLVGRSFTEYADNLLWCDGGLGTRKITLSAVKEWVAGGIRNLFLKIVVREIMERPYLIMP
jgi:hypothetical protein